MYLRDKPKKNRTSITLIQTNRFTLSDGRYGWPTPPKQCFSSWVSGCLQLSLNLTLGRNAEINKIPTPTCPALIESSACRHDSGFIFPASGLLAFNFPLRKLKLRFKSVCFYFDAFKGHSYVNSSKVLTHMYTMHLILDCFYSTL